MRATVEPPTSTTQKVEHLRQLTALPGIKDFYNLLYDRIYMVIEQFFLEKPFTLIINALPRNHEPGEVLIIDRFGSFELSYVGILRQRQLLEGTVKENRKKELDQYWNYLDQVILKTKGDETTYPDIELKEGEVKEFAQATSKLYSDLRDGKLAISDFRFGPLSTYFEDENNMRLRITQCEYAILDAFFNIQNYNFLSLPLIQFGEIDGVVHLVYHEDENEVFFKKDATENWHARKTPIGRAIKAMSREYEGLMLDWEVEGENYDFKKKAYSRVVDPDFDKELYDRLEENWILNELKYQEYYQRHRPYFDGRSDRAENIPNMMNKQFRQTAILSIIIDSYAHNITAHSLTALEWWFRQRWLLDSPEPLKDIINIAPKKADGLLVHEIHTMIRYLQDKGAFWTGLTRERSFGGKTSSLYSILWYGFARNSLLFGTIAFSEGILKVKINVSIVKTIENQNNVLFKKKNICAGHFSTIDLSAFYESVKTGSDEVLDRFVQPGGDFIQLKEHLKELKAFFPGSVVGQHAFYTILENELRNVKHYQPFALQEMRKDGLTLHISIEEQTLEPDDLNSESQYYLIGVWLEHPTVISEQKLIDRLTRINSDIVDPQTNRARLGGTSQDKICAAYLWNNSFYSVEQKNTQRDKRFYPWIKLGSSPLENSKAEVYEETVVSARRYFSLDYPNSKATFKSKYAESNVGYFKKFFHLWKGADVYTLTNPNNISGDWENTARFRFVNIGEATAETRKKVREEGIIRVIDFPTTQLEKAYEVWLKEWLQPLHEFQIQFYVQDDLSAILQLSNGNVIYSNQLEIRAKNIEVKAEGDGVQVINLVHGSGNEDTNKQDQFVRYRGHGVFKQHFLNYAEIHTGRIEKALAAELLEVLATNVLMFDNRIAERLEQMNPSILNSQLKCMAFREEVSEWQKQKELGFDRFHIIVLHLSFIETFFDKDGNKQYSEEDIKKFIDQEILSNPKLKDKRNFMLMITTGRGRTQWWEKLKAEKAVDYTSFVTFRPVESILSTIEDAFSIQDDIELKYRLIKVLFGS
ncbi:hypothetical protein [Haliscomenobacter hydrossis]|uniref:Uncharacterized protein n=1 Tax=Haliscomenobacter hydrossis (strain ATCC 27775 / DSM 1100 / LMG 10767 / O) TaxID=760192 RepID=F4L029_HALH1|nr:hypothetical protein [Haliscomenobacter hydrossis]AEE52738.1 hypothetical protein Halhy_4909 [Haliscomenobacter hydrossis DSM 1100]